MVEGCWCNTFFKKFNEKLLGYLLSSYFVRDRRITKAYNEIFRIIMPRNLPPKRDYHRNARYYKH